MQNQAGLSSQNCTITNLQAPLGCGPIALLRRQGGGFVARLAVV
jgi:hypothetical protein